MLYLKLIYNVYKVSKFYALFSFPKSNEPHDTMPIAAFGQKQRPSRFFMTPPRLHYTPPLQSPITVSIIEMLSVM